MKTPFALISCLRGTMVGIIAASAGAKNTVMVEMIAFSSRMTSRFVPARKSRMKKTARRTLVPTRTPRLSRRSTYTPATAEKSTAGPRNESTRMLTAVLDAVASRTMTVSPYSTMFPPICVNSWLSQSSRNGRLRKTSRAPPGSLVRSSGSGAGMLAGGLLIVPAVPRPRRGPGRHVGRTRQAAARRPDGAGGDGARRCRTGGRCPRQGDRRARFRRRRDAAAEAAAGRRDRAAGQV